MFESLEQMIANSFEAMRPTERLSVTEAAKRYHVIRSPGAHSGPWSESRTPYLVEPQDTLTSLEHTGMIFVGPARTGKSAMFLNWTTHSAILDPADMMCVHMAQHTAREWSKADLARMFRHSPEVRRRLRPGSQEDNTYDKTFLSGMRLTVTWPTITNLSGKTVPRLWIMDYDRIADDIDGEGNAFDLTRKRAQTFRRFGMTVAESSPGREVENPRWMARTPHEAPPTKGILELYNRGDRRRWYWKCPQCADTFEPRFELLSYPASTDPMESAEAVTLVCPCCGFWMKPDMKDELNAGGRWVRDGMVWSPSGEIVDRGGFKGQRSDIASFWLKGPAAAFQEWSGLVLNYIRAENAYEASGDEKPLQTTTNVDQGEPYIPKSRLSERLPEEMKAKAENWGSSADEPTVPADVRFLVATVDVQARAFVVQVQGFTSEKDMVIVDGFKIRKSARKDSDGDLLPLDPASFAEDWALLTDQVILRTYPLGDMSGRRMQMKIVGCDSGGREGVTFNAYNYWRSLRAGGELHHRRFALVKGDGSKSAPRATVSWPDSSRKDKLAAARGDVPVVRFNADLLKDQVAGMLGRRVSDERSGGGMIRYPHWFEDWFYTQMTNEVRSAKGWENVAKRRNESWDLSYYALGLALRPVDATCPLATISLDRLDFDDPPGWADEWDANDLVFAFEQEPRFQQPAPKGAKTFADLAKDLA